MSPTPSISVSITPGLTEDTVSYLLIEVLLKCPDLASHDTVVQLPLEIANIPSARFDGNTLKAFDQLGPLQLDHDDDQRGPPIVWRRWKACRETVGDVRLLGAALPRKVDQSTATGPTFDLREDNKGVVSSGHAIIPLPPDTHDPVLCEVRFDLAHAPPWCRAVWTHSTAVSQSWTRIVAKPSQIHASFFMVGPLQAHERLLPSNFTSLEPQDSDAQPLLGLYYLSSPPFAVDQVLNDAAKYFSHFCQLFQEPLTTYRIFIRHDPYPVVRSGAAASRSFMLSFGSLLLHDREYSTFFSALFAHEMTHNWLLLNEQETAQGSLQWYAEGLAEYYSIPLLYKSNSLSAEQTCHEINSRMQAYYTNPLAALPSAEVGKLTWKTANAQRLPYGRGLAFFIQLDALIRAATHDTRTLDDLVLDMVRISRASPGRSPTLEEFLGCLRSDLGSATTEQVYECLTEGKLVVPPTRSLLPGLILARSDQEMFDLGFEEGSILQGPRRVAGLRMGSRAAVAGIRDGDVLLEWTDLNRCKDNFEVRMKLKIQRTGDEAADRGVTPTSPEVFEVEFWPRSWEKVESYQYRWEEEDGLRT